MHLTHILCSIFWYVANADGARKEIKSLHTQVCIGAIFNDRQTTPAELVKASEEEVQYATDFSCEGVR